MLHTLFFVFVFGCSKLKSMFGIENQIHVFCFCCFFIRSFILSVCNVPCVVYVLSLNFSVVCFSFCIDFLSYFSFFPVFYPYICVFDYWIFNFVWCSCLLILFFLLLLLILCILYIKYYHFIWKFELTKKVFNSILYDFYFYFFVKVLSHTQTHP